MLLPALKAACSSAMIFSTCGFNLFSMIFSMTAWVTDEADRSVVLALLQDPVLSHHISPSLPIKLHAKPWLTEGDREVTLAIKIYQAEKYIV